jgi:hypothetical protein
MNYQHHTLPQFQPVPAVPIVVVSTTEGACRVLAVRSLFQGPTLCAVLDGVCRVSGAANTSLAQKDQP